MLISTTQFFSPCVMLKSLLHLFKCI